MVLSSKEFGDVARDMFWDESKRRSCKPEGKLHVEIVRNVHLVVNLFYVSFDGPEAKMSYILTISIHRCPTMAGNVIRDVASEFKKRPLLLVLASYPYSLKILTF